MSESYGSGSPTSTDASTPSGSTVDAAKNEAREVKDTASAEAGHVVETAKSEAGAVAAEAKTQVKRLYAQTTSELRDQAATQQQRAAAGLASMGDELRALAAGEKPESSGIASDLVREASTRVSDLSSWLGDRDPGSLLQEVKSYARRRPGTFIALAAVAGIVAGRLARALTEHNADEKADRERLSASPSAAAGPSLPTGGTTSYPGSTAGAPVPPATVDDLTETPLYAERTASIQGGATQEGTGDVRRDSL
ncbi:MAG TPA: hypothetical protein VNT50_06040 [Microbacterium sp.]|uniref:hypothetical protein n=1 Tax=Microbacterium sp. TaxID=51671 RepID=UPI002CFD34C6|nr:hypothetical protein [Microbacterium sp.]HWI31029.1 hypothetical protein [Microbacterium sp.]